MPARCGLRVCSNPTACCGSTRPSIAVADGALPSPSPTNREPPEAGVVRAARQGTVARLQAGDELAHQFRVAEDPGGRHQEGGARKSLAQMSGLRADAVLSRAR